MPKRYSKNSLESKLTKLSPHDKTELDRFRAFLSEDDGSFQVCIKHYPEHADQFQQHAAQFDLRRTQLRNPA